MVPKIERWHSTEVKIVLPGGGLHSTEVMIVLPGGGLHSTEVAFVLLTQQPRVRFPAFLEVFRSHRDLLTALLRVWTEA